jgi:hypothetical protein
MMTDRMRMILEPITSGNAPHLPDIFNMCVIFLSLSASILNAAWTDPMNKPGIISVGILS